MSSEYTLLQQQLLESIARAQALFIHDDENSKVFDSILEDLLRITASEYGFIGEVLHTDDDKPYLKTHAITNISWNEETRKFYEENAPSGLEFFNLKSLFGAVLTSEQPVIANNPSEDPRRSGIPEGHPPLNAFLGIPISFGSKMVAMVGVSNRAGGYDETIIEFLQPLLVTVGQLIVAQRNEMIRIEAERKLLQRDQVFSKLGKQVPGMIYQFLLRPDSSSCFPFSSDRIKDIYGFTADQLIDDASPVFKILHPDDLERISDSIQRSAQNLSAWNEEYRVIHPQKGELWLEGSAIPEKLDDGSVLWHGYISDISQRIKAQKNIERMALVAGRTDSAVVITDQNGVVEWVNDSFIDLTGYTLEEVLDKKPGEILQGEATDLSTVDYMKQQLKQQKGFEVELINYHKNGQPYWVALEVQPVLNEHGLLSNFISIEKDITERKQIEQALSESTKQLELVIDSTYVGVWDWQVQTGEVKFNERWADIIGYTLEELEPVSIETWINFVHPDDMEKSERLLKEHWAGESDFYSFEARMKHKKGHYVWVLDTGRVVDWYDDGKPRRMIGTHLDITERKQVELELHRNEALMRGLFELSPVGIALNDFETGKFIQINQALVEPAGYSMDEFVNLNYWDLTPKEYESEEIAQLEKLKKTGRYGPYEKEYIRKDGTRYPVLLNGMLVKDSEETGQQMIWSIVEDITERKRAEQTLIEARDAAEAAVQAKSDFLASMSHEIRTPMNGVLGMLSLLFETQLDDEQRHRVKLAQSSGQSLLHLINDILDFSKVDAGKLELEQLDFNLRHLIGELAESMAHSIQEKGLELILDIKDVDQSLVKGDPNRLRQVLTNLVANALKFTEQGEIIIRAQLVNVPDDNWKLVCSVADTGIGVPIDKLDTLFDSFSQVDASTTRKYGGTGLGLAICKKICELMGGDVDVTSVPGKGSTFNFNVLLGKSELSRLVVPEVDMTSLSLLIVDDNTTNREVLRTQLEHWGAEVVEASSGQEAIKVCEKRSKHTDKPFFDIALLDMQMPEMDGASLGKELKANADFSEMKLVMMTSIGHQGDAKRFADLGFSAYFPKPATTSDLFDALAIVAQDGEALHKADPLVTRHYLNTLNRESKNVVENSQPDETAKEVCLENCRILLVEDNTVNQLVATGILNNLGVEVDVAADGQEALNILRDASGSQTYALILMDCQMPNMGGYEATQQIRTGNAGQHNKSIPIIAMTANAMEGDREKCLDSGMNDYVPKPIDPDFLFEKLDYWHAFNINGTAQEE